MIRPLATLAVLLAVAGCATAPTPPARGAPRARIPSAPPRGEPAPYADMPAVALQAALGRPAFVRKDGATQMWRYDGAACRAFFFLYGAPLAVRHVETLPRGRDQAADPGCLTALRATPPKVS